MSAMWGLQLSRSFSVCLCSAWLLVSSFILLQLHLLFSFVFCFLARVVAPLFVCIMHIIFEHFIWCLLFAYEFQAFAIIIIFFGFCKKWKECSWTDHLLGYIVFNGRLKPVSSTNSAETEFCCWRGVAAQWPSGLIQNFCLFCWYIQ